MTVIRSVLNAVALACLVGCGATERASRHPQSYLAGQEAPPSLNGRVLAGRDGAFRFVVAGHIYGSPGLSTEKPARSLVGAVDRINDLAADLFVAVGDSFWVFEGDDRRRTMELFDRIQMPVFQAVGNHEMAGEDSYIDAFGPTYGAFVHGDCLFVLLDAESDAWDISGEQLQSLRRAVLQARQDPTIRNVFFFAHKLVFAQRQRYFELLVKGNSLDGLVRVNNFYQDVLPLLADLATQKRVFWFAGDVGTEQSYSLFWDRDPESGVVFLATGVGDTPRDALVIVEVSDTGEVVFGTMSLGQERMGAIHEYGVAYWRARFFPNGLTKDLQTLRSSLPR